MTLKLEVGKTYVNRFGNRVKIIGYLEGQIYSCIGDDKETYIEDGRFTAYSTVDPRNLISEATPEPQPSPEPPTERILASGLTLREHFAGLIMAGAVVDTDETEFKTAQYAVRCADALIAALEGRG